MGAPVHAARFAPGVIGLIMDGERPARVPNNVIDELKGREHNGIIALPKKPQLDPRAGFQINDRCQVKEVRRRALVHQCGEEGRRDGSQRRCVVSGCWRHRTARSREHRGRPAKPWP